MDDNKIHPSLPELIHPSHIMSEWESTVVTIVSTPRFGKFRFCTKCGAEQAQNVAGSAADSELYRECK